MNRRLWLFHMSMNVLFDGFNVIILRALQLGIRASQGLWFLEIDRTCTLAVSDKLDSEFIGND